MRSTRTILVALVALIAVEVLFGMLTHRSREQLEAALAAPEDARERMWALHVLANRDDPVIHTAEDVRSLLASGDPVLREFAMTYDFARADGAELQWEIHDQQPEEVRMGFFVRHQSLPMHRPKVGIYFGAGEL